MVCKTEYEITLVFTLCDLTVVKVQKLMLLVFCCYSFFCDDRYVMV